MRDQEQPGPGQESVWDYPRPPRIERCDSHIQIQCDDLTIADSNRSFRVLETSHPPVYYLAPATVQLDLLIPSEHGSFCEWKGFATYYSLELPTRHIANAAWAYLSPSLPYSRLRGYIAFYPSRVDACFVDDERVRAQEGDFYGGWITEKIVGPFKGGPGTSAW